VRFAGASDWHCSGWPSSTAESWKYQRTVPSGVGHVVAIGTGTPELRDGVVSVAGGAPTEHGPRRERSRLADRRADERPDDDIAEVVHAGVHA
jgi:hypothetical protein